MSSSSAQLRKIKKPLIEKRRRERMNVCLNQLKNLILEGHNTNESRYSKMEKVDILEMTVRYLKEMRFFVSPVGSCPSAKQQSFVDKYIEGFNECAAEVGQYLQTGGARELNDETCQRLFRHLMDSLRNSPAVRSKAASQMTVTPGTPVVNNVVQMMPLAESPSWSYQVLHPSSVVPVVIGETGGSGSPAINSSSSSYALPTMFTVLSRSSSSPSNTSPVSFHETTATQQLAPPTTTILPMYVSPDQKHSQTECFAVATASSLCSRVPAYPSQTATVFRTSDSTSGGPTLFVVTTGQAESFGRWFPGCCSSPKQGDEYPSGRTPTLTVTSECLNNSPPSPSRDFSEASKIIPPNGRPIQLYGIVNQEGLDHSTIQPVRRVQGPTAPVIICPSSVWRPWNGKSERMS